MENVLIIGLGEIGKPFAKFVEDSKVFNVYKKDIEQMDLKERIDVMHICLPGDDAEKLKKWACDYIQQYKPTLTINNSTVVPGTTEDIYKRTGALIVHSPYRGDHKLLSEHIRRFTKFIGPTSQKAGELAKEHFEKLDVPCEVLRSAKTTELGKLLDTTIYARYIADHQEYNRWCEKYGVDFNEAVKRFSETFILDKNYKTPRPVATPGYIGGHCLIPNAKMLYHDLFKHGYRAKLLELLFESNSQRAEEIGVKDEIKRED